MIPKAASALPSNATTTLVVWSEIAWDTREGVHFQGRSCSISVRERSAMAFASPGFASRISSLPGGLRSFSICESSEGRALPARNHDADIRTDGNRETQNQGDHREGSERDTGHEPQAAHTRGAEKGLTIHASERGTEDDAENQRRQYANEGARGSHAHDQRTLTDRE